MSDAAEDEPKVPSNKELANGLKDQIDQHAQFQSDIGELNEYRNVLDEYAVMLLRRARANARQATINLWVVVVCVGINIGSVVWRAFL